jgi:hypothetical protein
MQIAKSARCRSPLIARLAMLIVAGNLTACCCMKGSRMNTSASHYVEAFRRGEEFRGPSSGLVIGGTLHAPSGKMMQGQPDPTALAQLAQELETGTAFVRLNVVALLVDVGLQADPGRPAGTEALLSPEIIDILVKAGLGKRDAAREASMDALRKLARPADLSPRAKAFVKALEEKPTKDGLLLVAKAKAMDAKPLIDELAQSGEWKNQESLRIAQASLGDKAREDEFVQQVARVHDAKDSRAFMQSLAPLAMIGTRSSLAALARHLRTPLTLLLPGTYERSLRLSVLEALMYYYPERPEFYPNNVRSEADYEAAERFCARELGVTYDMPTPPFMTYRPFPRR